MKKIIENVLKIIPFLFLGYVIYTTSAWKMLKLLKGHPSVGETWVLKDDSDNPFRNHPNDTVFITGYEDGYVRYIDLDYFEGSLMSGTFKIDGYKIPDSDSPFIFEIKIKK